MRAAIFVAALTAVAGCGSSGGNVVDLTITSDGSIAADALARVRTLRFQVSGAQTSTRSYTVGGLHAEERVQLLPSAKSGMLTIAVSATDDASLPIASGSTMVMLSGHDVPASLTLGAIQTEAPVIEPGSATVTRGKSLAFTADRAVSWSVLEADGGSIGSDGVYTAPAAAGGPFTIVATSMVDGTSAHAVVTVADYGVELIAGALGGPGESDGTGGVARFFVPEAIVSDGNGAAYIGDSAGCTVRKVDLATNAVTTIAGRPTVCVPSDGVGTAATLGRVTSLALDGVNGILWIGEFGAIHKLVLATGAVTALQIGSPATTFGGNTTGLAYDPAGSGTLYSTTAGQHVVRKFALGATVTMSFFAGTAGTPGSADGTGLSASFRSPNHLAFDGTNLWVADSGNDTIRKIVVATMVVTTPFGVAGMAGSADGIGNAATFKQPTGIAFGNLNTLYVADSGNGTVRAIALANNSVATLAGMAVTPGAGAPAAPRPSLDGSPGTDARFDFPQGIVYEPSANTLLTVDRNISVLRQIALGGQNQVVTLAGTPASVGFKDGVGSVARLWNIGTVATGDGKIFYVSDNGNAVIRKLDLETGVMTTLAGSAGLFGGDDGVGAAARFERPEGLVVEGQTLYITDGSGGTVRKMDLATNTVSTIAGSHLATGSTDGIGSAARFAYPAYAVGDGNGHLYISDISNATLRELTLATGEVKTVAGGSYGTMDGIGTAAQFRAAYGIAIEGGALYVCDVTTLRKVTLDNFTVTTVAGSVVGDIVDGTSTGRLASCSGMLADGKGHLYLGDEGAMRRFDIASGALTTIAGKGFIARNQVGPLATARLNFVSGLAFTAGGDILFDDSGESALLLLRAP